MQKKKKNPNSERNSAIVSYLLSLLFHALLCLILGLLLMRQLPGGSSLEGGRKSVKMVPIGVVAYASTIPGEATALQPQPTETTTENTNARAVKPINAANAESPVKVPDDKNKKNQISNKPIAETPVKPVVKTQPKTIGNENAEHPGGENGPVGGSERTSAGGGGEKPIDTKGADAGEHKGGGEGPAPGAGIGPFPNGAFGFAKLPKCLSKTDENNDSLTFKYDVTYKFGVGLQVVFAGSDSSASPATIEETRRKLELGFAPEDLDQNKTYNGTIKCRCGSNPKCELVK
jgi:hypothetical protein